MDYRHLDNYAQKEYNQYTMYNWSTDIKRLKKDPEKYSIWKLEQLINYGLNGEKLKLEELKKNFNKLAIDPQKKRYLKFLLTS